MPQLKSWAPLPSLCKWLAFTTPGSPGRPSCPSPPPPALVTLPALPSALSRPPPPPPRSLRDTKLTRRFFAPKTYTPGIEHPPKIRGGLGAWVPQVSGVGGGGWVGGVGWGVGGGARARQGRACAASGVKWFGGRRVAARAASGGPAGCRWGAGGVVSAQARAPGLRRGFPPTTHGMLCSHDAPCVLDRHSRPRRRRRLCACLTAAPLPARRTPLPGHTNERGGSDSLCWHRRRAVHQDSAHG